MPIVNPPIVPPSNKTFEPVNCPLSLSLNSPLELDIALLFNTNPPIVPPVNKTREPVIFPEPLKIKDLSGDATASDVIVNPPMLPASAVIVPCIVTSPVRDK